MKKGFISMTIIYSFLLVFIFTLLALLVLYTQKSRLVDSIVMEAKEQIYFKETKNSPLIFEYTGDYQIYTVSKSGYYFIETYGAQGGRATNLFAGGKGGYSSGYIYLDKDETLYIFVGGSGAETSQEANQIADGGYNGGGSGYNSLSESGRVAGGGGGATDIRYFGSTTPSSSDLLWNSELGLKSRIIVAGGGGGSWYCATCMSIYNGVGGAGGGLVGGTSQAIYQNDNVDIKAIGGSQKSTSFGLGANGASEQPGGGGGYYGGNVANYTAGGGSSFISGYAGSNAIISSSNQTASNTVKHYSGKYFVGGMMKQGINSGNGKATITYIGSSLKRTNTKLDNVRYIRNCTSASSINEGNHFVEMQAIKDGVNLAKGKSVMGSNIGSRGYITDGNIEILTNDRDGTGSNICITIDLGSTYNLDQIGTWHYEDDRVYFDNKTLVSNDNSNWKTLLDDDGASQYEGNIISAYDEFYSNYEKANYITLNGTTKVDTGIKPSRRTRLLVDASASNITTQLRIFSSTGDLYFEGYLSSNSEWGAVLKDTTASGGWTNSGVQSDSNRHMFELNAIEKKYSIFRDLNPYDKIVSLDLSSHSVTNVGDQNLLLFGRQGANYMAGNVYSAKVYDNTTLVRDFIPVTRINDSSVGLYDRVNDVFYEINGAVAH